MAFIDLSKAFDTVNRDMLWQVLQKFGCPPKFVNVIKAFHSGMMATVLVAGEESEPFAVEVGVKQGCAMAPVLFNIYLAAANFLFARRNAGNGSVHLVYRLDGSLFNLQRLKARTKVSHEHLSELQYADDCALIAHTAEDLQRSVTTLHEVYAELGLLINPTKTEILYQWHQPPSETPTILIESTELKVTNQFVYIGSIMSSDCSADTEVNNRINKASAAFARIRERVIKNHNLRIATKIAVYRAICLSVLLYGSETITLNARQIKVCLSEILGLSWQDRVPHVEILRRAGLSSIECVAAKNQLRWVGHVCRMPDSRYPKQVLYGQLAEGQRPAHGPKKRFKDHLKKTLKSFEILPSNLEREATNRTGWRGACSAGATRFEDQRTQSRETRRARRHDARDRAHTTTTDHASLTCPECGRRCLSRIGLFSHMRVHQPGSTRGRHVIGSNA